MSKSATLEQADLFAKPARAEPESPERALLRARLEALAIKAGQLFGPDGFMLADVRHEAVGHGILTGYEGAPHPTTGRLMKPRELSWLGDLLPRMARRGLVEKVILGGRLQYGNSAGERSHGNKQALWRLTARGVRVAEAMVGHGPEGMRQAERMIPPESQPND